MSEYCTCADRWPALDLAHSVSGLLAGIYGSEKWMSSLDKMPLKLTAVGGK